jgi:hypothetical protein
LRWIKPWPADRAYGDGTAIDEERRMKPSITQLLVHLDATDQVPLRDIDDERRKSMRARFDQVTAVMAN